MCGACLPRNKENPAERTSIDQTIATSKVPEDILKKSEYLRTIIENSRDGINLLDLKTGKYVFMNSAQIKLTGFTFEEINNISAKEVYERTHPDDRQITLEQQKKVAAGEDVSEPVEYRWRVKSGEYRWFSESRRLVRDEKGQTIALVGISRDITEQKRAEEALRLSEERFSKAFNLSPFAVIITRLSDGTYVDVNDSFLKMFEFSRSEVIGHTAVEIGIYAKADGRADYVAAFKNGRVTDFEVDLKTKTGKPLKALGYAEIINVNGQNLTIGTLIDITERKKAEEALRQSESMLQNIIDESPAFIFLKGKDGRFITINKWLEKSLGMKREQLRGKTDYDIFPKEVADYYRKNDLQVLETKLPVQTEEIFGSPDGKKYTLLANKFPLFNSSGEVIAICSISTDITQRKKAEEELKRNEENARQRAEELRKLMDIIPAAVWLSRDPECKVIVGNQAANTFYEAEGEENVSAGPASGKAQTILDGFSAMEKN